MLRETPTRVRPISPRMHVISPSNYSRDSLHFSQLGTSLSFSYTHDELSYKTSIVDVTRSLPKRQQERRRDNYLTLRTRIPIRSVRRYLVLGGHWRRAEQWMVQE